MTEKQVPDEKLRATDIEREATVERLGAALAAGCLTMAEFEERTGAAWAAARRSDLSGLTVDLPPNLPKLDGDRRDVAERMLLPLQMASLAWVTVTVVSVVFWGLMCLAGGPHSVEPWFLWVLGGGAAVLVPAWQITDSWRR